MFILIMKRRYILFLYLIWQITKYLIYKEIKTNKSVKSALFQECCCTELLTVTMSLVFLWLSVWKLSIAYLEIYSQFWCLRFC